MDRQDTRRKPTLGISSSLMQQQSPQHRNLLYLYRRRIPTSNLPAAPSPADAHEDCTLVHLDPTRDEDSIRGIRLSKHIWWQETSGNCMVLRCKCCIEFGTDFSPQFRKDTSGSSCQDMKTWFARYGCPEELEHIMHMVNDHPTAKQGFCKLILYRWYNHITMENQRQSIHHDCIKTSCPPKSSSCII